MVLDSGHTTGGNSLIDSKLVPTDSKTLLCASRTFSGSFWSPPPRFYGPSVQTALFFVQRVPARRNAQNGPILGEVGIQGCPPVPAPRHRNPPQVVPNGTKRCVGPLRTKRGTRGHPILKKLWSASTHPAYSRVPRSREHSRPIMGQILVQVCTWRALLGRRWSPC